MREIAMVRCKFIVDSVTQNSNGHSVKLMPVTSGSPENDQFFKWTPWGAIEIGTINASAAEQFEVGQAFYVDFTPVE